MPSAQSVGSPSARAKTFVDPPLTTASAGTSGPGAVGEEPVDDLVDRSVATKGHHDIDAVLSRLTGQADPVTAPTGIGDVELGFAPQRPDQHISHPVAGRRRLRIAHQQSPHSQALYRPV